MKYLYWGVFKVLLLHFSPLEKEGPAVCFNSGPRGYSIVGKTSSSFCLTCWSRGCTRSARPCTSEVAPDRVPCRWKCHHKHGLRRGTPLSRTFLPLILTEVARRPTLPNTSLADDHTCESRTPCGEGSHTVPCGSMRSRWNPLWDNRSPSLLTSLCLMPSSTPIAQ